MNKLSLKNIKADLEELQASKAQAEIIINNVRQYNQLVEAFKSGDNVNQYLMYQLNIAINNQLQLLKKAQERARAIELKEAEAKRKAEQQAEAEKEAEPLDKILQMIKATKNGNK
jgi:hypothetical protein